MKTKQNEAIDDFLKKTFIKSKTPETKEEEVCDLQTGECYVIRTKDGIVERLNKTYITEDGRQLLQD